MAPRENPFPATAVTTFGVRSDTFADLSYMRQASKLLVRYLQSYRSKGLTVGLTGAHGGGKTFLLSRLASEAAGFTSAPAYVIYGKADSPSFLDLYRQVMQRITRDDLIKVMRDALRLRAEDITGKAKATKSAALEIQRTGELDSAYASKVIDPNELNLGLRRELERLSSSSDVGRRVAAALGLVDDPTWGEAAFGWLAGGSTALPNEALQTSLFEPGGTNADETVVAVLEVVAALFHLAGTPLVILVDQLENLVHGDGVMHTSSILKKLLEQLSLQGAMFVMAGTPRAWKRLPRDVRPRIAARLNVGNLSLAETRDLLKAYLRVARLPAKPTAIIFRVAGGNPREILQTAFQIHEETRGKFGRANEELIRTAAAKAGTLQDREQVALEILDQVAAEESFQVQRPSWRKAADLDRLAVSPEGKSLAVIFAVSSDPQAETELALRLTRLKRELSEDAVAPEILAVAIGYSSDQVRALLSDISRILIFNEAKFADQLKAEFARLVRSPDATAAQGRPPVDDALFHRLDKLESLLSDLQQSRAAFDQETAERFSTLTEQSSEPERRKEEIRTRLELREGLDQLSVAFERHDFSIERSVLRGLLVANEANIGNEGFDTLGTIYLDALQLSRFADGHGARDVVDELQGFRSHLIRQLRQTLSTTEVGGGLGRLEVRIGFALIGGLAGAVLIGALLPLVLREFVAVASYRTLRLWCFGLAVPGFAACAYAGYLVAGVLQRPERRYAGMARYLDSLARKINRYH